MLVFINVFTMGLPPFLLARNFKRIFPGPRRMYEWSKEKLEFVCISCGLKKPTEPEEEEKADGKADDDPYAGLKWIEMGWSESRDGRIEVENRRLASALWEKQSFTHDELESFGLAGLKRLSFVLRSDGEHESLRSSRCWHVACSVCTRGCVAAKNEYWGLCCSVKM